MASPDNPILNSPFDRPGRHWLLDPDGGFTTQIVEGRRRTEYLVPIAPPATGRIAVKAINHYGDEVLKDFTVG